MAARSRCPECGSTQVLEIVYGMPGPELEQKAMAGKVVLGGCCVHEHQSDRACGACGAEWERAAHRPPRRARRT